MRETRRPVGDRAHQRDADRVAIELEPQPERRGRVHVHQRWRRRGHPANVSKERRVAAIEAHGAVGVDAEAQLVADFGARTNVLRVDPRFGRRPAA